MNAAFVNSYEAVADTPPIADCITEVPSKGRVENYPWIYPPPMMHQWKGYRQYAKLAETNYRVPNRTYTAEFECNLEDLDDDQLDGFRRQAASMAKSAKEWKYIESLQNLALGQTVKCFDDTFFFATSHNVGTGNNILTGTASATDAVTHAMVILVMKNKMVKPLMWQNRDAPDFQTDGGSIDSKKIRTVKWWADMRGAPAFGFWFDALLVKFANTPTVADMQTTFGNVNARLRGFTLPKNLLTDPNSYPHGQIEFSKETLSVVNSTLIDHIVRQALTLSLISTTENPYVGFARQITTGYLDGVA